MQSTWSSVVGQAGHDVGRRGRVERQARVEPGVAHGLKRVVHVRRGLPVDGDRVGARPPRSPSIAPLRALDHEVHVEHAAALVHQVAERVDDQRADRDRRHEVAVHHVHVDDARAGVHDRLDLLAEAREVGRQDRGRDADVL